MYHCDHFSGDKAVWRRMPMPGGRSRHQLIPLPRHFHLSGLTACITHPQGRCACVCFCVYVLAGEGRKTRRSRIMRISERQTGTLRETLQVDLLDVEFPNFVKIHLFLTPSGYKNILCNAI